jgi:hypothetical protein
VPVVKRSGSYSGKTGKSGGTKSARAEAARNTSDAMASEKLKAFNFSSFAIYW